MSLYFALSCSYGNGAKHSKDPVGSTTISLHWVSLHGACLQVKDGVESLTLILQHAVGDGEFTERGVASVRSLRSSTTAMSLSQHPLSHHQLEELKVRETVTVVSELNDVFLRGSVSGSGG